jgi:ABC-type lipoprotein export system ATPase subunit
MAGAPRLILIDDVLDLLDEHIRPRIVATLFDRGAPWTVIVATRDPELIAHCDRIIALPAQDGHSHDGRPPTPVSIDVTSANRPSHRIPPPAEH